MNKRARIIVIAAAALAVVAVAGLLLMFGPARAARTRQNVLASAQYYLDKGDYDRALDLLDKLLIDNAGDSDARALRDTAMRAKSGADATKAQAGRAGRSLGTEGHRPVAG